eukprot:gene4862-6885_t
MSQPTHTVTTVVTKNDGPVGKEFIPVMHPAVAIILAIINFVLPGFGTILAGFFALCGIANPGSSGQSVVATFCCNFFVGILQLATVIIFLLGWIWSIMWGITFIAMSSQYGRPSETTTTIVTSSPGVSQQGAPPPAYNPSVPQQ